MYQKRSSIFHYRIWLLLIAILLLSGCGNRFAEQLSTPHQLAVSNLDYLKQQLDDKQLVNALLIDKYATQLSRIKPEYADIAKLLRKESTAQGKAYTGLAKRLAAVNLEPTSEQAAATSLNELNLIQAGADAYEFNSSLADVVNTLASLSEGELSVINVPVSQQDTAQKSNALVGNPTYGSWKQDSSGRSFWEWYGMYSMFSNVFGGRNYYYDSWSSRPSYSYYNNYGRNRWGSTTDFSRNYNLSKRYPSQYNRPSTGTKQRYSAATNRSSSYGSASSKSASSSYKSTSSNIRSSSSYGSSSRSSSFSSSRSSRSGK